MRRGTATDQAILVLDKYSVSKKDKKTKLTIHIATHTCIQVTWVSLFMLLKDWRDNYVHGGESSGRVDFLLTRATAPLRLTVIT